jgi:hypothetical protein
MCRRKLIGRTIGQTFMWPLLVVKVDPQFCRTQKLTERVIRLAFSHRQLENADEALSIAIVCRRASTAHRELKAFLEDSKTCLLSSILTALIGVPNGARDFKLHELHGRDDQIRSHPIIKSQGENMAGASPQSKAAAHARSIGELDLEDIGEQDFRGVFCLLIADEVGRNLGRPTRIDVPFLFATRTDPVLVHDPLHPVFAHPKQRRQLAMAQRVVTFVLGLNRHGNRLILPGLFGAHVVTGSCKTQGTCHLALAVGTIGRDELRGQFHLLCRFYLPNSPCTFFRISFCTVNSPMILLRSSGDSPGA